MKLKEKEIARASSPPAPAPPLFFPEITVKIVVSLCVSQPFFMMSLGNNPDLKALLAVGMGLNNREAGQLFVPHSKRCLLISNTHDAISEGDPPLAE